MASKHFLIRGRTFAVAGVGAMSEMVPSMSQNRPQRSCFILSTNLYMDCFNSIKDMVRFAQCDSILFNVILSNVANKQRSSQGRINQHKDFSYESSIHSTTRCR